MSAQTASGRVSPETEGEVARRRAEPVSLALSRLLAGFIFWTAVALVVLLPVPYGAAEPRWEAAFEVVALLLATLWAFEGGLSGGWFRRAHLLCLPPLALAAYAFLQSTPFPAGATSFDPYETRLVALELFTLTTAGGLLIRYADTGRRRRALAHAVIISGAASAIFGLVRRAAQLGDSGFVLEHLEPGVGFAQFVNHNHFAFLAEMALGLAVGLAVGGGGRRGRSLVYAAAALVLWAATVMSGSRGGLVGSAVALLSVVLLAGLGRRGAGVAERGRAPRLMVALRVAAAVCLLPAILVGVVWVGGETVVSRVEKAAADFAGEGAGGGANTSRQDVWRATWALFEAHPFFGVGFGGYWVAITETHEASGALTPQQAHNDFLELLASGGAVGATLFAAFVALVAIRARRALRRAGRDSRAVALGAAAGLCSVAAHSLFDFGLHLLGNALSMTALIVLASGDGQKTSRLAD